MQPHSLCSGLNQSPQYVHCPVRACVRYKLWQREKRACDFKSMQKPSVDMHLYIFGVLWCCCKSTAHAGLQMSCHMQYQSGHSRIYIADLLAVPIDHSVYRKYGQRAARCQL